MFENIKKVLDEFEKTYNDCDKKGFYKVTKDEEDILCYLDVNLAKALMQDKYIRDESIAKIIFATKELSNEIKVKVE